MRLALLLPLAVLGACSGPDNVDDTGDSPAPSGPVEYTDVFAQVLISPVDILWVIDNSGSMAEEQDILNRGFQEFADQLEQSGSEARTDFNMGVITTSFDYSDPDRGRLIGDPPFLTPADDYEAGFAARSVVVALRAWAPAAENSSRAAATASTRGLNPAKRAPR